jgi:plastocyanin
MEWECTFTAAGEFITYCILHGKPQGEGMAAKLIVSER